MGKLIPFYGGENPELFEIERRCMDREGEVISYLDKSLPFGPVLDVGAGNGFTAHRLNHKGRLVVAMEPNEKMVDLCKPLVWSKGFAQDIPFHTDAFQAAYATWAFFFDGITDLDEGLAELERVVASDGKMIVVDNFGQDEFSTFTNHNLASNVSNWEKRGFTHEVIETAFVFDSVAEGRKLFAFYFGKNAEKLTNTRIGYNVVAYTKVNQK